MSDYVGTPYVVLSRSLSAVDLYVETGEKSNDLFILTTGNGTLTSFTSEYKHTKGGSGDAITTDINFLDIDNKFEELILQDSMKVAGLSFMQFYFNYGLNGVFGPTQVGYLSNIKYRGYSSGSRIISLILSSGLGDMPDEEIISGINSNLNATAPSGNTLVFDDIQPGKGESYNTDGTGSVEEKIVYSVEENNQSFNTLSYGGTTKRKISRVTYTVTYDWVDLTEPPEAAPNSEITGAKNYYIKGYDSDTYTTVIEDCLDQVFNRFYVGKKLILLPNMGALIGSKYPVLDAKIHSDDLAEAKKSLIDLGFEVRHNPTTDAIQIRIPISDNFGSSVVKFVNKLNSVLDDLINLDFHWESDTKLLKLLSESDPPLVSYNGNSSAPIGEAEELIYEPTLIISDEDVKNQFLYGTYSNKVKKYLLGGNSIIGVETPVRINEYLLNLNHKSGKKMTDLLGQYSFELFSRKDEVFSNLFSIEDLDVILNKSLLSNKFEINDSLLESIKDEFILFKYNIPNSNVLSLNIDYEKQDYASLANIFEGITDLEATVDKLKQKIYDKPGGYFVNPDSPESAELVRLNKILAAGKNANIKEEILNELNKKIFYINMSTLPLFTLSTKETLLRLVGLNMKLFSGTYNNEDNPIERIYNGLWTILGFKHTITNSKVQSDFTLMRSNTELFNK